MKKSAGNTHLRRHRFDAAMAAASVYAGVDEVGRGCLAGPVVAAAVIPPTDVRDWTLVDDSKRLTERTRNEIADIIMRTAVGVGIGYADVREIDELNILRASQLAMGRALASLSSQPEIVLVDGNYPAHTHLACLPIIAGDARSLAIAAASIVAKVNRDTYMKKIHEAFPEYGFDTHVGYGTKAHLEALAMYGPTVHHRMSFAPVRETQTRQVRLVLNG
ncbi:ribonuclease HII [Alicyclobacillus dauci]|uniref:Ribonuclease HII n=1 Tax=Alicyclobacillus dauci TaxID=1475485 RepID=A0ABY6YZP6_9BACL|nr:ribonuclease HII [Alicyclobacillus dauci]WAH35441.1 ribonuclease HII [Alicyclobacillus dauci]